MGRNNTVRRYGADRYDHAIEKNHGPVARESAAIAASAPVSGEAFSGGGTLMECCGSADGCVCRCPRCSKVGTSGELCAVCDKACVECAAMVKHHHDLSDEGLCAGCDTTGLQDEGDTINGLGLSGLVSA